MTKQNQAEHQSNAADDSISEGIGIGSGRPVVEVAKQSVAYGGAGDRQCQREQLEKEVRLLRAFGVGGCGGAKAVCIVPVWREAMAYEATHSKMDVFRCPMACDRTVKLRRNCA